MDNQVAAWENPDYEMLDNILEEIYTETVKIDETEQKLLVKRFKTVMDKFIAEMKNTDPGFHKVFKRIGYTGSFYDGIRVGEATEYDLNLILDPKIEMGINEDGCRAGYIGITVLNKNVGSPVKDWVIGNSLRPPLVKQWLEGIVQKTVKNLSEKIEDCKIHFSKSGPAITLRVFSQTKPTKEICIDLVPVFMFPSSQWPPIPRKSKKTLNGTFDAPWFAVPKKDDTWRISFPIQEQKILKGSYLLKYTLRLLKKVRDEFGINKFASYYVKTLFLWELEKTKNPEMWTKRKGALFMHMLIRFKDALQSENLPFYWDQSCNLIEELKIKGYLRNSYGQVNNFIKKINKYIEARDQSGLQCYIREKLCHSSDEIPWALVNWDQEKGTNRLVKNENEANHKEEETSGSRGQ